MTKILLSATVDLDVDDILPRLTDLIEVLKNRGAIFSLKLEEPGTLLWAIDGKRESTIAFVSSDPDDHRNGCWSKRKSGSD